MGPTISFEAQKLYYASNIFSLCTVEQGIYHFLHLHTGYSMRRWKDGLPPSMPEDLVLAPPFLPRDHVRNLQIRIKAERLNSTEPLDSADDEKGWAAEQRLLQSISDNLCGLLVPNVADSACKSNIELVIMTKLRSLGHDGDGESDTRHFVNLLEAIRHTVYTLIHDCNNCTVQITHLDDHVSPFPRDLTEIFSLTPTGWHDVSSSASGSRFLTDGEKMAGPRPLANVTAAQERLSCGTQRNGCDAGYFVAPASIRLRSSIASSAMDRLRERWRLDSALARRSSSPIKNTKGKDGGGGIELLTRPLPEEDEVRTDAYSLL